MNGPLDAGSTPASSSKCRKEGPNEVGRNPREARRRPANVEGVCSINILASLKITALYVAKAIHSAVIFIMWR